MTDYKKKYHGAVLAAEMAGVLLAGNDYRKFLSDIEDSLRIGNIDDIPKSQWDAMAKTLKDDAKAFRAAIKYMDQLWATDTDQFDDEEIPELNTVDRFPGDMN